MRKGLHRSCTNILSCIRDVAVVRLHPSSSPLTHQFGTGPGCLSPDVAGTWGCEHSHTDASLVAFGFTAVLQRRGTKGKRQRPAVARGTGLEPVPLLTSAARIGLTCD